MLVNLLSEFEKHLIIESVLEKLSIQADPVKMELLAVSLLLFLFCGVPSTSSQFISLDIPQHQESEDHQSTFTTYTTKKYYFVTYFKANFFRAHQYCLYSNMELLTIDSKEEEAVFLNLINNKDFEFKTSKEFWTSGTDLGDEGKFFFITNGRTVDHLSWSNEEPNNGKKSDTNETENCMSYTRTDNLKFYRLFDRFCSLESHFVCQEVQQRKPFRQ